VLLARSLQMLGRAPDAVKAYARAVQLVPRSAQLHADYADMQVAAAGGQWTPGAIDAVAKALEIDPSHPKSLWLAGTEAYARKDYTTALQFWEKLAPLTEPGSEVARMIQGNIAEVRALVASGTAPAAAAQPQPGIVAAAKTEAKPAARQAGVSGTVELDPSLAAKVKPGDTVFVFARAAQGPKMPLAIRRVTVQDLPYTFALDDSAAMAPGMTISAFEQVVVGARVSRAGDAAPRPGDFEGYSAPVKPGTGGIRVRIDAQIQ
jgi:cytochrome c-type biogenesis protein CcmH